MIVFFNSRASSNGARKWQWYTRSTEAMMERINELLTDEDFPIRCLNDDDPNWDGDRQFHELALG